MGKEYLLEVCCGSVDDTVEARLGGADRVELNSNIFFGGLTPTIGSVKMAKEILDIPVMVMIRPRGGGFCYTEREMRVMEYDTQAVVEHGADGIVFGILNEDGTLDEKRCERIIELAQGREVVFHRAFDVVPEPKKVLDRLVDLGVNRVLTTGQQNTLYEGMGMIKELQDYAEGRIEILPGGGSPHNAADVIMKTGCSQIHMAAFTSRTDTSTRANPNIYYGAALWPPEDKYELIDQQIVRKVYDKLWSIKKI